MVAPPLIAATVYASLSRVIVVLDGQRNALIGPAVTTTVFVLADVGALFTQLAGIGLQAARNASAEEIGKKITIAGLVFQLVLFLLFISCVIVFDRRNQRSPTMTSTEPAALQWRRYVIALYVASGAILVRNIIRTAEYAQGGASPIERNEAFLYIFDALLMWTTITIFVIFHPARLRRAVQHSRGSADTLAVQVEAGLDKEAI